MKRAIQLILILVLIGCAARPTKVTVRNDSSGPVTDVQISGRGFAAELGSLLPGESRSVFVHPGRETGLAVSFKAGLRRVSLPEQGYFEGGGEYVVLARIQANLSVAVSSDLAEAKKPAPAN